MKRGREIYPQEGARACLLFLARVELDDSSACRRRWIWSKITHWRWGSHLGRYHCDIQVAYAIVTDASPASITIFGPVECSIPVRLFTAETAVHLNLLIKRWPMEGCTTNDRISPFYPQKEIEEGTTRKYFTRFGWSRHDYENGSG